MFCLCLYQQKDKYKESNNNLLPYVPGDFTDVDKRHDSYESLATQRSKKDIVEAKSAKGYPKYREDFSRHLPTPPKQLSTEANEFYNKHKEMLTAAYNCAKHEENPRTPSPVLDAIENFNFAKKLHKENLEHEPLPDTITDALYRKLQLQKFQEKEPALALKDSPQVTGIGWKGYPGYGPTRCTKLKVYRPKTGIAEKQQEKRDGRPNSVSSFDKKWRFIRQSKVTPIELAICWDLTPDDPQDEPKPPTHIDGSNGSQAPAVFTLVHTPKEDSESSKSSRKMSDVSSKCCEPVFEKLPQNDITNKALPFLHRPKTTCHRSSVKSDSLSVKSRAQSASNLQQTCAEENISEKSSNSSNLSKKTIHRSSPNVSCANRCTQTKKMLPNSRLCMACELKNLKIKEKKPKQEYKMAFKAGVPQPVKTVSKTQKVKFFRIPKQVEPYKQRNYAIKSLAAPFSLQKDKRQDYPDHWRLATVYQHSYKPIHLRKRPLLASIFK